MIYILITFCLLLNTLQPKYVFANDVFNLAYEKCLVYPDLKIDIQMPSDKQKSIIENHKNGKSEACAEVEEILTERKMAKSSIDRFLIQAETGELLVPIQNLYIQVDLETKSLALAVDTLKSVTTEISNKNNAIFQNLKAQIDGGKQKLNDWSLNWRKLHLEQTEETFKEMVTLSQNPRLTAEARQSLSRLLSKFPNYLTGSAEPPRDRLKRLQEVLSAAEEAIARRNRYYISVFRNEAINEISSSLDPKLIDQKAKVYYLKSINRGITKDPISTATIALSEGACFSARFEFENAIQWIGIIKDTAPLQIKPQIEKLAAEEEPLYQSRLDKIGSCNSSKHIPRLRQVVEQRLKQKCAKQNSHIDGLMKEATINFNALSTVDQKVIEAHSMAYQLNLEKVWRDLKLMEEGCKDSKLQ